MQLRQMTSYSPSEGCIESTLIVRTLWHQILSRCYSASLLQPALKKLLFDYLAATRVQKVSWNTLSIRSTEPHVPANAVFNKTLHRLFQWHLLSEGTK